MLVFGQKRDKLLYLSTQKSLSIRTTIGLLPITDNGGLIGGFYQKDFLAGNLTVADTNVKLQKIIQRQ